MQRVTWWFQIEANEAIAFSTLPNSHYYWPIASVKAHYWLGVAYEQQGQKDEAMKEYEKFLDIWKDTDFKSPEMQDARSRIGSLKGTATR